MAFWFQILIPIMRKETFLKTKEVLLSYSESQKKIWNIVLFYLKIFTKPKQQCVCQYSGKSNYHWISGPRMGFHLGSLWIVLFCMKNILPIFFSWQKQVAIFNSEVTSVWNNMTSLWYILLSCNESYKEDLLTYYYNSTSGSAHCIS